MIQVTFLQILWTLSTIIGLDWSDWQNKFGELVGIIRTESWGPDTVFPILGEPVHGLVPGMQGSLLTGPPMADEEHRLNSFWSGYYGAVKRFYGDLDKLDWVAYYNNHGYLIGLDSSGSPLFVPMIPRIEWTFGTPEQFSPGRTPPINTPFATPGLGMTWSGASPASYYVVPPMFNLTPIAQPGLGYGVWYPYPATQYPDYPAAQHPPTYPTVTWYPATGNYAKGSPIVYPGSTWPYPPCQYFKPCALTPAKEMVLNLKLMEAQAPGPAKELQSWPNLKIDADGTFEVAHGGTLTLHTGTVQDLLAGQAPLPSTPVPPPPTIVTTGYGSMNRPIATPPANGFSPNEVPIGTAMQGKVTKLADNRIRLDLTLEKSEVENAGKESLLIAARTYQLAQRLQLGQRTKAVLQNDSEGEAKLWLEMTVTERDWSPLSEGLNPSNLSLPGPWPISVPSFPKTAQTTQVRFDLPRGMIVEGQSRPSTPRETPTAVNFVQGTKYNLWLKTIEGRPGLKVRIALDIPESDAKSEAFLGVSAVNLAFTNDEFDHIAQGESLVKVIYLPDPPPWNQPGVPTREIVSTRLSPGVDPVQEARKRGTVVLIVRTLGELPQAGCPSTSCPTPLVSTTGWREKLSGLIPTLVKQVRELRVDPWSPEIFNQYMPQHLRPSLPAIPVPSQPLEDRSLPEQIYIPSPIKKKESREPRGWNPVETNPRASAHFGQFG